MLTITDVLSNESDETHVAQDGKACVGSYSISMYATDQDGRPWRLTVHISGRFGFTSLHIERTDTPGYRESVLEDEYCSPAPVPTRVELFEALARITSEFERAGRAEWTGAYPNGWARVCTQYNLFTSIMAGDQPIAPYP